jgi:ABC-type antimicrobial peptide transport system permease subunit
MNWKTESTYAAVAAALVAVLSAFGLITTPEGAALSTSLVGIATGVIGIVGVIASVRARRKAAKEEADKPAED